MKKTKVVSKSKVVTKKKLTPAQMRVEVAKDVLKQLKAEKYIAQRGTYFVVDEWSDNATTYDFTIGKDLKSELKLKVNTCSVCALGALFCSYVRKFDNVKSIKYYDLGQDSMHNSPLGDLFGHATLDAIEDDFETYENGSVDEEVLTRIAKNIIKNNGTYKRTEFLR
jgi:hypothetical protein